MDNANNTTKEYIRLEEDNARRCKKVYNWESITYGKIWYDDDIHDLRSIEIKFLTIVFNDELTSKKALSYEPTVSSLNNNKINFRILLDESNEKDYTHRDAQGQSVFTSHTWRRFFELNGPLVFELIMKFFSTLRFGEAIIDIDDADTL
nr:hypothetical protein [Tanacetum cinerariifolium]